jgi:hypothetical protein
MTPHERSRVTLRANNAIRRRLAVSTSTRCVRWRSTRRRVQRECAN